jgi:hypothetical protein
MYVRRHMDTLKGIFSLNLGGAKTIIILREAEDVLEGDKKEVATPLCPKTVGMFGSTTSELLNAIADHCKAVLPGL